MVPDLERKSHIAKRWEKRLEEAGFTITGRDLERPWGGYFEIDESQSKSFIRSFLTEYPQKGWPTGRLSPKILLVQPDKRLSWQYHKRRSECWQVVEGPVGVVRSPIDEQGELSHHEEGDLITLGQGERHRLVGLEAWGVIAEIWVHTDPENPSSEEDIVRVEDDFGR